MYLHEEKEKIGNLFIIVVERILPNNARLSFFSGRRYLLRIIIVQNNMCVDNIFYHNFF